MVWNVPSSASSRTLIPQFSYLKSIEALFSKWNLKFGFENIALFGIIIVDSVTVAINDMFFIWIK